MRRLARPLRACTALSAITIALAGCSLAPRYTAPAAPVPAQWPDGPAYPEPDTGTAVRASYAEVFLDPRLRTLIAQAEANNRDLRIAAANVVAAREQVRVVRADQFPAIGATAAATHRETGGGFAQQGWSYSLQGGISAFELDLFGKLANATRAQQDRALSTQAAARTVRLSLVADLAQAWATYAADRDLLAIADATARNAQDSVALSQKRLAGGIAARTELRQAQQVLETARGDLARQTTLLAQDRNAIRLLVGTDFDETLLPEGIDAVNAQLAPVPVGTTTQVLLRRPDVVEAEYQLRAANADIGVARAQLFPSLSLTALAGFASRSLSALFDSISRSTTLGGNASWSIFNAGGRTANVRVSEAQRDAALATYERAIQTAFSETADALADQGTLAERLRSAQAFTGAAQDSAQLTEASYRQGIASSLDNLDAQRSLYAARRAEVAVRLQAATNRITLYRVLGGDRTTAPLEAR